MIRRAGLRRPDAMPDVTMQLWEGLAGQLISVIGEGGFQWLYTRSIHLSSATYPWMAQNPPQTPNHAQIQVQTKPQTPQINSRFVRLKILLEQREMAEASEASIALLITFIDILALLIGEPLTNSILRSAWGDDALDSAAKELQ